MLVLHDVPQGNRDRDIRGQAKETGASGQEKAQHAATSARAGDPPIVEARGRL